ncbi:nitroreductase family deazaflavin-dependent oxidoreductase [Nocardia jejuensis]|uniref:nitroreductase family deazaflavin-dependent oxidoreductase n=1 Tax=Nocardia jejuensis TaxID=328049 RepID=UPI000A4CADC7|nr:nitroreductase family deazaflavin-dependent oxidoreductase [Nocardia jejuensis]
MANGFSGTVAAVAVRLSSMMGPRRMRTLAKFNRYVTNPVQRLWAPRLAHYALIEHVGRKSGKTFRTPVMVFVENDALSVLLNYGAGSDWVRNIQAADGAELTHRGRRYRLTDPRVLPSNSPDLPIQIREAGTHADSALYGILAPI